MLSYPSERPFHLQQVVWPREQQMGPVLVSTWIQRGLELALSGLLCEPASTLLKPF